MNLKSILFIVSIILCVSEGFAQTAYNIFIDNLKSEELIEVFSDMYEKLDGINWAGKNISVSLESLAKLHPSASVAVTDERVVVGWNNEILSNYARPMPGDWRQMGQLTASILLAFRQQNSNLAMMTSNELYDKVVGSLVAGIGERAEYIPKDSTVKERHILTSVGLLGHRDERGNYRVSAVYQGSPADNVGIKKDDIIVDINGVFVSEIVDESLLYLLNGFNSGTLKMTLLTPNGNKNVVLHRASVISADADVVHRGTTDFEVIEIIVHSISDSSVNIIKEALQRYPNIDGLVLDFRTASGYDEEVAAAFGGIFMGQKSIMRVIETTKEETEIIPFENALTDVPVVVVVSNTTTGTAEALAAAFMEHKRGVLIGTPTAGIARIANRIELNNGDTLRLLNKAFRTANGNIIDKRGIFPIVCLSNIRSANQQNTFFVNLVNGSFNAVNYNLQDKLDLNAVRRGCPVITNGADEDMLVSGVAIKILNDKGIYESLIVK